MFTLKEDTIIAGGHSLWFRSYFRAFLPQKLVAPCKAKKMINGACVGLTLLRAQDEAGSYKYAIEKDSVQVIYGGF